MKRQETIGKDEGKALIAQLFQEWSGDRGLGPCMVVDPFQALLSEQLTAEEIEWAVDELTQRHWISVDPLGQRWLTLRGARALEDSLPPGEQAVRQTHREQVFRALRESPSGQAGIPIPYQKACASLELRFDEVEVAIQWLLLEGRLARHPWPAYVLLPPDGGWRSSLSLLRDREPASAIGL